MRIAYNGTVEMIVNFTREINMSQVGLSQELKDAAELIRKSGGTVHFPRRRVVIWGHEFTSLKAAAKDPQCEVSYLTLFNRISEGIDPAEAVKKNTRTCRSVVCWGETFTSIWALSLDPRCKVCYNALAKKIAYGVTPDEAVKDDRIRKPITTISQAIVGG